jgi:hypothetical protein
VTHVRRIVLLSVLLLPLACATEGLDPGVRPTRAALTPDMEPDGEVTMTTVADFKAKRDALLTWVWGQATLPKGLPAKVMKDVPPCEGRVADDCNPLGRIKNLKRVDNLFVNMELGERSVAHHFIPVAGNRRLVIMHKGHGCDFGDSAGGDTDYGEVTAIESLVAAGFSVLGMYMPRRQPGNCDQTEYPGGHYFHDHAFKTFKVASGSVVKFWVEPIAVNLNYLKAKSASDDFPSYLSYDLMGLSGGGWTTVFYAALDPSIEISIQVGGTVPLYMRKCEKRTNISPPPANCNWGYDGDSEQTFPDTYKLAGYLDLYALGAQGANRKQIQILNRRDGCCFGEAQAAGPNSGPGAWDKDIKDYEKLVQAAVTGTKAGSFQVVIDEKSTKHEISRWATANLIVPTFSRGGKPEVDTAAPDSRPAGSAGLSGSPDAAAPSGTGPLVGGGIRGARR